MSGHDGRQTVFNQPSKGNELAPSQCLEVRVGLRQVNMGIVERIAVSREVLSNGKEARRLDPPHGGRPVTYGKIGYGAECPIADDLVFWLRPQVKHRPELDVRTCG